MDMDGYSNTNGFTPTSTTTAWVTVYIDGRAFHGTYDETAPAGSVTIFIDTREENTTPFGGGDRVEELKQMLEELKEAVMPLWEFEDWSPRMKLGSACEGVYRPPQLNRPMRRQRRPPSWARRKRA